MENIVTQRVRDFMQKEGLSILAFSKAIGVPQSTLNQQLNGRNGKNIGVQISVIAAILSAYPNLSAEWLLRGEGAMDRGAAHDLRGRDEELVAALRDNIEALKESNALLREKVKALEAEKKGVLAHGHVAVAVEEGVR